MFRAIKRYIQMVIGCMFGLCQKVIDGREKKIREHEKTIKDNAIVINHLKLRVEDSRKLAKDLYREKEEIKERNLADSLEIEERFLQLLREKKEFEESKKEHEKTTAKTPDELIDEISNNVAQRQADKLNK